MVEATSILPNEQATLNFGAKLAQACENQAMIFLYGNLGAGKTTLTRGFLQAYGYNKRVKSPTYSLVESYPFANFSVYHFDLYRLRTLEELEEIGIRDYIQANSICLIEWPEQGKGILPIPDIACYLKEHAGGREIKIIAETLIGKHILERFRHAN